MLYLYTCWYRKVQPHHLKLSALPNCFISKARVWAITWNLIIGLWKFPIFREFLIVGELNTSSFRLISDADGDTNFVTQ